MGTLEAEVSQLRVENRSLLEEVAQCQADKEFVWSLWKRLQVANPDVTQAIAMVIQREREKTEYKDTKVLEILNAKDEKINQLRVTTAEQSKELSQAIASKAELQGEVTKLMNEAAELKDQLRHTNDRLQELEDHSKERLDLAKDLERSLKRREDEAENLRKDKEDLTAIRDTQRTRIQSLEADSKEIRENYDAILKENQELKLQLKKRERALEDCHRDLASKGEELESVRKELSDLWQTHTQTTEHAAQQAELIKQLQSLQQDTHKMLKNQENAFSMETSSLNEMYSEVTSRYHTLKKTEMQLREELRKLQMQLFTKEGHISELKHQLDDSKNQSSTTQASTSTQDKEIQVMAPDEQIEYRLHSMQSEIDALRSKLAHRDSRKEKSLRRSGSLSPSRRPRSVSTNEQRKVVSMERKLEEVKQQLKLKNEELEELRSAHNKRLDRLKALQKDYRLIKKQLKVLEEEKNVPPKPKKKLHRSDPKSLQKEDSDTVWNELSYFRNENKTLLVENMNLGEEVDSLRVQVAQDAATIHELRTCLEQEREELQFMIEQQERCSTPTPDPGEELSLTKAKLEHIQAKLKQLTADYHAALKERDTFLEEKRKLRSEINAAKQELAGKQIENTDLRKDIYRLQREIRKRKRKSKNSSLIRRYQQSLNNSKNVNSVFDELDKDGWENISESEEQSDITEETDSTLTEQTLNTSSSLGQNIVEVAKLNSVDTQAVKERQADAEAEHVRRMNIKNEAEKETVHTSPVGRYIHTQTRDVALSPIHFGRPHVISIKPSMAHPGGKQLQTYRNRIATLQKEVKLLKTAKALVVKREADQKVLIQQLQTDLTNTSHKLHTFKLTIARLNGDVERLKQSKEELEVQLNLTPLEDSTCTTNSRTEEDWALLQSKLRVANHEVSKQLAQIKQLKQDNQELNDRVKQLQDRVNHLDRDIAQKRTLVDEMRFKLKVAQENAQSDAEVMLEVENKLKTLADTNHRYKSQVDIYKEKVQTLTKSKYINEDKVLKLTEELDKKNRQVQDLQRKTGQLQGTLNELEKTAQSQMHALAGESRTAIVAAQAKLATANRHIQEFHKFLKIFTHTLLTSIHQGREKLWRKTSHKEPAVGTGLEPRALARARQVACSILNLSQSDLEDILSIRDDDFQEEMSEAKREQLRKDKKWGRKWEKLLKSQSDFASTLAELMMEKVNEKSEISVKIVTVQ